MQTSLLKPIAVVSQILSIDHQTMVKLQLRLHTIIWHCCGKSLRANQAHRQMREFLDQALDGSEVAIRWWAQVTRAELYVMVCPSHRQGDGLHTQGSTQRRNIWREVSRLFMDFARRHGSADLLMKFALG